MKGLIIKGIGGFYYVKTDIGILEAKGRGNLKSAGTKLYVGDMVKVEPLAEEAGKAVITEILPRKNQFIRPPIVNVDVFVITLAAAKPNPNFTLLDKFLIMAEISGVDAIICINKEDLVSAEQLQEIKEIYEGVYPVICVSAATGEGIDSLKAAISGKTVALAGPSGVGKSSILNCLHPEADMETGDISKKTGRGKHTTRHVEIFSVEGGGLVYDTPGFTSFEIMEADEENLQLYYPEMEAYREKCYYNNCRHLKEPDCAVREAVSKGKIGRHRYDSYVANMEEIKNSKKY